MTARIEIRSVGGGQVVIGWGCPDGCVASASFLANCPQCHRPAIRAEYGPEGVLWAKTTLRIPAGDYPADRAVGYVDLDGGTRVLCELADDEAVVGERVRIARGNGHGDPVVVAA